MDVLDCIKTRRSCRKFLDKAVEEEKINTVVEAGRYAPSGGNCQSAHFVVVKDRAILSDLADLVQKEFGKMQASDGMYISLVNSINKSKQGNYRFHYDAPVFIIVANRKNYGNAMADSACALQNMMLAANALELGSCWINQLHWLDDNEAIREYLKKLDIQDDETVCGALSLGYAENLNRTALERKGNKVSVF